MLDRVIRSIEKFRFQMSLADGSKLFITGDRVPDSRCRDAECFGLEVEELAVIFGGLRL